MKPALQSVDENQAPTWCKRGIHAAQLGIQMFAQLRTVPEAKFLDPLPAGAPAMSMNPRKLMF